MLKTQQRQPATSRRQFRGRMVAGLMALSWSVSLTGCAAIFGPYSALQSDYVVSAPGESSTAENSATAEAEYPDQFDAEVAFAPQDTARDDSSFPSANNTEENPFAEMAQQQLQQPSTENSIPDQTSLTAFMAYAESASASTFHEAVPRMPTSQPGCPAPQDVVVAGSPLAQAYPDEYIFDGGDRDHPVHYYGGEMEGLDTEDTVAEFKDHTGRNHVNPSNRVAVYAPRFGAVQTVSGPTTNLKIDRAAGARDVAGPGTLLEERGLNTDVGNSGLAGLATRSSASGVETSQPAHMSQQEDSAILANKVDQGLEAKVTSGLNILQTSDVQELSVQILEPVSSKIKTGIDTRAATTQATQTYSTFRVQATVGSEQHGQKGDIHITKEASTTVAKPGDVITFSIRFRNTGDYPVQDVRIIDNLTPRLAYVNGSGQIDVGNIAGGSLTAVPNKEGSQTLIFELDEALKGGKSGTITFDATVR